jgi:4-hydroxy-tetrahydrodipicolinate synthase
MDWESSMKYERKTAKDYARKNFNGIWAAALTPFKIDLTIDEDGLRRNVSHWADDLAVDGAFIGGKQGEFFSMSVDERKEIFDIAASQAGDRFGTIMSCSDQNLDVVVELALHAQKCGADYIVVHAPVLSFFKSQEETLYEYYKYVSERVDIGIALWSHQDSGYLMSPDLCNRIADLPNVVAIKYSVPRPMYAELTRLAGDRILISTASEEEWLDNILELDWKLYLCSNPPILMQTRSDRRMRQYTDLAFAGKADEARTVRNSLDPVREALRTTRPPEKPQAHAKYWQELLGQAAGPVRRPLLPLTAAEKVAVQAAMEKSGLNLDSSAKSAA